MKLTAINFISNTQNASLNKNPKTAKNNYSQATNSIASNTLQEAIGRSQVSFKGVGKLTDKGFEYEQKYPFSSSGEDLKYDFSTGELKYNEYYSNGDLKKTVHFIHEEKTSIVTEYNEDHTTTKTITAPQGVLIEIKDEQERQTYYEQKTSKGTKIVETDYDRKRKVFTVSTPNTKPKIKVIDLNTGESVTKGPLVEDVFDVKEGILETRNIVTGEVYKREERLNKGKYIKITDFSRETGIKTRETEIQQGETTITDFNKKGLKQRRIITNKKGNVKTIIKYGEDGIHEVSKVQNEYNSDRKISRQTVYQPNHDTIQMVIDFAQNGQDKTYHYYSSIPNIKMYSDTMIEDNLVKRVEYYDDGKTPKKVYLYDLNGSHIEEYYKESGKKPLTEVHYFDSEDMLCKVERYDTQTGKDEETRELHPSLNGHYIVKTFDIYSGKLQRKDIVTHKDVLMERVYFHENGQVPRKIVKFNQDRSYSVTTYDEAFKIIDTKEYNADRTPKL